MLPKAISLRQLLQVALGVSYAGEDAPVTSVVQDHRRVTPGALFVARQGASFDAHAVLDQVIAQGAVAVVGQRHDTTLAIPYITVANDRVALAKLAVAFYDNPASKLVTFGVTGTDGKTTTAFMLHHLLQSVQKTGLLSTAGIKLGAEELSLEGHFTTPEAPEIQRLLAQFVANGAQAAVLETSSHGFSQHRLDGIDYQAGILTNLTPEHLDFHKTLEAYIDAKCTLMRRSAISIINRDDAHFADFAKAARRVISYGRNPESDWRILDWQQHGGVQHYEVQHGADRHAITLPMIGEYNAYNALAALIAAHTQGHPLPQLLSALATFPGVPGRMQVIQTAPFTVIVDFAHTPAALHKLLSAVRAGSAGRLIVVIGAAGERDPGKRQPLGEIAVRAADVAIFTEEDSRSEDIGVILAQMAEGAIAAGGEALMSYWCIPDRREAMALAFRLAEPGDTVILAGKGHERTLERRFETLPWDEAGVARSLLESMA
jgi:UDP-N-acetylmuramoyl-L-alanyl-D-glutamate--2,6-diaminopimelate ligase